jgi:hypothetical protein
MLDPQLSEMELEALKKKKNDYRSPSNAIHFRRECNANKTREREEKCRFAAISSLFWNWKRIPARSSIMCNLVKKNEENHGLKSTEEN